MFIIFFKGNMGQMVLSLDSNVENIRKKQQKLNYMNFSEKRLKSLKKRIRVKPFFNQNLLRILERESRYQNEASFFYQDLLKLLK